MHYGLGGINGGGGAGGGGRDELPVWSVLVSSMTKDHKISKDCRSTSCLNVHVAHATHVQAAGLNSTTRSKMKASAASAADCSAALRPATGSPMKVNLLAGFAGLSNDRRFWGSEMVTTFHKDYFSPYPHSQHLQQTRWRCVASEIVRSRAATCTEHTAAGTFRSRLAARTGSHITAHGMKPPPPRAAPGQR
eukprot:scaffold38361_cov49-Phaeocystis_antarctica.AAC.3